MSKRYENGVIVGCDQRQEWLLPWWWSHFQRFNRCSVSFVDFGLSCSYKSWCKKRGQLLSLSINDRFVKDRDEVKTALAEEWERRYPDGFWESRKAWFKKPLACLASPYQQTIWLDLDCEIVKPLDALFDACDHPAKIALAIDQTAPMASYPIYNSGVIVFKKNHPLLIEWAKQAFEKNSLFRGDQDLLSRLIAEHSYPIHELDPIYNWSIGNGQRSNVAIYHWLGDAAKAILQNKINLDRLINGND